VRSKGFRRWLGKRYFEGTRSAPSAAAVGATLYVLEARAQFERPTRSVDVPVAGCGDRIYVDLATRLGDASRSTPTAGAPLTSRRSVFVGRRACSPSPRLFLAAQSTGFAFTNLRTDTDFVLVVAWLLAALRDPTRCWSLPASMARRNPHWRPCCGRLSTPKGDDT
jgi:hypothetical protein